MQKEPWAKFTTPTMPKMSDSPEAISTRVDAIVSP